MAKQNVLVFYCYSNKLPQNSWPQDQNQGASWAVFPLEGLGENLSPCLFQPLESVCIP